MTSDTAPSTYVEVDVHTPTQPESGIEPVFDSIADALHATPHIGDADLAVNLATEVLTFCVTLPGALDPERALRECLGIARRAIHSAGLDATLWEVIRATVEPTGSHKPMLLTA